MKKQFLTAVAFIMMGFAANAQVGIGTTTPNSGAALDITSTNKGLLLPRVANTAAITAPVNGMMIYDISSNCYKAYQNNAWSDCGLATVDLISSALTTNKAAYAVSSTNTWVQVTQAEYNAVASITSAAKYGRTEAAMSTASPGGFGGGWTVTTAGNGTTLPGSNYIIGLSFVANGSGSGSNGFKLKYAPSATPTTSIVDYPNASTFTNPAATYATNERVYYILKSPTTMIPAGTYVLGAYFQSNLALGSMPGGSRNIGAGDVDTITPSDANTFLIQVIGATTKSW